MKKLIFTLLLCTIAYNFASAGDDKLIDKAIVLIQNLNSGNIDSAYATFDSTMKAALKKSALEPIFPQLTQTYGKLNADSASLAAKAKRTARTVAIPLKFEKVTLAAYVTYDASPEALVAGLYFRPYVEAVYAPPAYADTNRFVEKQVSFGEPGWELPAILTIPDGVKNPPCVVLVHGSGPHDYDETVGPNKPFKDLAWGLATLGIASLRYDKRTFAHSSKMLSAIKTLDMNGETIDDAVFGYEFILGRNDIDPKRIFILGHSQGGYAIPRIASRAPKAAGFIIMAGLAQGWDSTLIRQYNYIMGEDGKLTEEETAEINKLKRQFDYLNGPAFTMDSPTDSLPLGQSASYWKFIKDYNPTKEASPIKKPVLVLQGEADYQVTVQDFELWKKALSKNSKAQFKLYPGMNHLFQKTAQKSSPRDYDKAGNIERQVIEDISNFIGKAK